MFSEAEQKCLTSGIYFESRGESVKGQAAVAQVILNRVRNPAYPDTICAVVYQNKGWYNRCQFSFACDRIPDIVWSRSHWQTAKEVALAVTAGKIWLPEVGSATHYHATYVKPDWGPTMKRVVEDRQAHLLPHLWRRMELKASGCRLAMAGQTPAIRGSREVRSDSRMIPASACCEIV